MMICPKCGFEQEERLDCIECGIVFSKYNALFQQSETSETVDENTMPNSELHELQLQVRELNSRLIDSEFEKTERKKLRSDVKNLEQQCLQNQEQSEARMQRIEDRLDNFGKESEFKKICFVLLYKQCKAWHYSV